MSTVFDDRGSGTAAARRTLELELALREVLRCSPPFDRCRNEGTRLLWWASAEYGLALRRGWEVLEAGEEARLVKEIPKVQYGLGLVLQRRRIAKRLTIAEVARRAMVDRHEWAKWERAGDTRLRPLTLAKVAAALGTTIEELTSGAAA